jgi:hypothetical protein
MRLTSPVALLVLLGLAGCGGGNDSFTEEYNQAVKPLAELQTGLGSSAAAFDRLATRTKRTRENLADLDPPDEARDEMDKLLSGLDGVTRDLNAVAEAVRAKDFAEQADAAEQLVKSSSEVQRAESRLQQAVEG